MFGQWFALRDEVHVRPIMQEASAAGHATTTSNQLSDGGVAMNASRPADASEDADDATEHERNGAAEASIADLHAEQPRTNRLATIEENNAQATTNPVPSVNAESVGNASERMQSVMQSVLTLAAAKEVELAKTNATLTAQNAQLEAMCKQLAHQLHHANYEKLRLGIMLQANVDPRKVVEDQLLHEFEEERARFVGKTEDVVQLILGRHQNLKRSDFYNKKKRAELRREEVQTKLRGACQQHGDKLMPPANTGNGVGVGRAQTSGVRGSVEPHLEEDEMLHDVMNAIDHVEDNDGNTGANEEMVVGVMHMLDAANGDTTVSHIAVSNVIMLRTGA